MLKPIKMTSQRKARRGATPCELPEDKSVLSNPHCPSPLPHPVTPNYSPYREVGAVMRKDANHSENIPRQMKYHWEQKGDLFLWLVLLNEIKEY